MAVNSGRYAKPILLASLALAGVGLLSWFLAGGDQVVMDASQGESKVVEGGLHGSVKSAGGDRSAAPVNTPAENVRPPILPLTPYALSPSKLSLGAAIQDVMARSDGLQALRLGRILSACATIDGRERALDLRRAHPTGDTEFDRRSLKEQSDQLNQIKSECQTVQGNPTDLMVALAELAVSQEAPGAAQMLLSLNSERSNSALLGKLVEDSRRGEWLSVMSAVGGRMVPDAERTEMLLALRRTYGDTKAYGTEFDMMYRMLLAKVWSTPSSGGQSAMTVPRGKEIWHAGTIDLPPEVQKPTDPQALARIERLTALLTRQVREMQAEREDARRRAAGG